MIPLTVQDLGSALDFGKIWEEQERLVKERREGLINDSLLLLEHSPVYTIGRTRDQSSLNSSDHLPHPVVEINRGGQGTYHGPGQLVGYAILDLTSRGKDLHRHLRDLEEVIIVALSSFKISAHRRDGLTGVWVENRKIASLGVGVRAWVTMHGFALNVQEKSLPPFQFITPCGLDGVSMTSAESETGGPIDMNAMKMEVTQAFTEIFG